jgi:hypothetical protein
VPFKTETVSIASTPVALASDRKNPGVKAPKFVQVFRGINPPAPSGTTIHN